MLSVNPGLTPVQVKRLIKQNAIKAGFENSAGSYEPIDYDATTGESDEFGSGILDAGASVAIAEDVASIHSIAISGLEDGVAYTHQPLTIQWQVHEWNGSNFDIELVDETGATQLIKENHNTTSLQMDSLWQFQTWKHYKIRVSDNIDSLQFFNLSQESLFRLCKLFCVNRNSEVWLTLVYAAPIQRSHTGMSMVEG